MRFIAAELLAALLLAVTSVLCLGSSDNEQRCRPNEFRCEQTRRCIDRQMVRNKYPSCGQSDTSDEDRPPFKRCHPPTEFRCRKSGQCISRRYVNVAIAGCNDLSDDGGIAGLPCDVNTEFRCLAGNCIPRRAVNNKNGECHDARISDEGILGGLYCHPATEFKCADGGRCIGRDQVLDKSGDCPDDEDENETSRIDPCASSSGEFRCPGGRCIERWRVGDGRPDCKEGTDSADEMPGAISQCNQSSEFRCSGETPEGNFQCIPRSWVNDGLSHCADGSDERVESFKCTENEWSCDGGARCLSRDHLCNGILDCADCSDETDEAICSKNQSSRFFVCTKPIGLGESFRKAHCNCSHDGVNSSHCVYRSYFCDGVSDCADGSDEQRAGEGFKCRVTNANTGRPSVCVLPPHLINDDVVDCDDGSDETRHFTLPVNGPYCLSHFLNTDNLTVIRKSQVCDGIFDCSDLSDECLCHVMQGKNTRDVCGRVCRHGEDSEWCNGCNSGFVGCKTGNNVSCISTGMICDGKSDCSDGSDEASCHTTTGISPTDRSGEIPYPCPLNSALEYFSTRFPEVAKTASRCDGVPECVGLHDECDNVTDDVMCAHVRARPSYCEHLSGVWSCDNERKPLIPASVCDGVKDCTDGIDEKFCEDIRFECEVIRSSTDARKRVSIKQSQVCDGFVDCIDRSDELNCANHFYCRDNSTPLFVDLKSVLDGQRDCSDGSDECPDDQAFADDPLSSRDQLIKQPGMKVWLWLMAVVAIVGNISVIVSTARRVQRAECGSNTQKCCSGNKDLNTRKMKVGRPTSSLAKCNDILVLNLAVADFLTGVYLISVAIKSMEFSGSYCTHQVIWRSSLQCQSLGVLVLTSCQVSVGIMVILTTYRLYAVVKPWNVTRARVKVVIGWICVTWFFAIAFALLPTLGALEDAFVTSSIVSNTGHLQGALYFPDLAVTKKELGEFVKKACLLLSNSNAVHKICNNATLDLSSWYSLRGSTEQLVPDLLTNRKIGYYGAHGVCLPTFFHINALGAARFTLFVMAFNFVSFAYIAAAYAVILYRSAGPHKPRKSAGDSPNPQPERRKSPPAKRIREMHGRITRLVLTDFVCWVPVCILSFCGISGVDLPPIVYSLTAVVLLPVNSALNPLLYSDVVQSLSCAVLRKVRFVLTGTIGRRKDSFPFTSERSNSITNLRRLSVKPEALNCDAPVVDARTPSSGTVRDRFISLMLMRDRKESHVTSRMRTQLSEVDTSHVQLRHNVAPDTQTSHVEALIQKTTTM